MVFNMRRTEEQEKKTPGELQECPLEVKVYLLVVLLAGFTFLVMYGSLQSIVFALIDLSHHIGRALSTGIFLAVVLLPPVVAYELFTDIVITLYRRFDSRQQQQTLCTE
jgi:hypothetical protein